MPRTLNVLGSYRVLNRHGTEKSVRIEDVIRHWTEIVANADALRLWLRISKRSINLIPRSSCRKKKKNLLKSFHFRWLACLLGTNSSKKALYILLLLLLSTVRTSVEFTFHFDLVWVGFWKELSVINSLVRWRLEKLGNIYTYLPWHWKKRNLRFFLWWMDDKTDTAPSVRSSQWNQLVVTYCIAPHPTLRPNLLFRFYQPF